MTYFPNIAAYYEDSPNLDAFGKLRISEDGAIFTSKMQYDNQPLLWDDQQVSGSGTTSTYNTNQSSVTMSVSASTAGKRVRRTFQRFNYQSGKSQLIYMTGVFGTASSGITKNMGYYSDNNGIMFRQTTVMNVVVRTNTSGSPVETIIPQSSWNVDKLDGTGPSGLNVDFTKGQIYVMDFEWLGVGRIRFGLVLNGQVYYCHYVTNYNSLTTVWCSRPNLPLTYDITNSGTGGAASLVQICSSVISEGGIEPVGYIRSINRGNTGISSSPGNFVPVISIRLNSTTPDSTIIPLQVTTMEGNANTYLVQLFLNPTIGGSDAASWVNLSNSAIQYDVSRTNSNILTGGTVLYSQYVSNQDVSALADLQDNVHIGVSIAGVSDQMVLGIMPVTGGATTYYGGMTFLELM